MAITSSSETVRRRVAVIGAGPMGLATAWELCKLGHQVELFEAGDRVGGMSASFDFGGIKLERYYHFICTNDHPHLELLQEFGLADRVHWNETGMGFFHAGRLQEWGNPLALFRFKGMGWIAKFRYGLHAFVTMRRKDWRRLDREQGIPWLQRWIGREAFELMWKSLFELKFHDYAEKLSAAWIWSRIHRLGRSRYDLMREKLGYLEGGAETLMLAMAERLQEHGVKLHLSTPVQEVLIDQGEVRGVRTSAGETVFDGVISTVPLPYVAPMLPGLPQGTRDAYQAVENLAVICVVLKLARPVSKYFWLNISEPDIDIPGIIEYSQLNPLPDHIVYAPYYMPAEHPLYGDEDQRFVDKVFSYVKRINPEVQDADLLDACVNRYRFAQPVCGPGFLERLPPMNPGVAGLYVADTCYYYPHDRGVSESVEFGADMARMLDQDWSRVSA